MGFWNTKRICVTGGKGFLGSHIIKKLDQRGCKHIAVSDLPEYDLTKLPDIKSMFNEKTSIEKQLIPRLLKENCSMKSFIYDGHFYDIGTENRLINFTNYIASI